MFSGKAKLLGKYALESGLYFLKRAFVSPPSKIDTIVVDLDYTLIETLTAYRALEMMLGPDGAKEAYAKQKALVKSGKANFADVKNWGHLLQMQKGWVFNPKTTMAISDADPQLLRKCGVGVLVPVGKSEDPASYVSQKFKLRDVEFVKGQSTLQLVNLVLNPRGKPSLKGSVQARRPRRRARIGRLSPYSRQNRRRP